MNRPALLRLLLYLGLLFPLGCANIVPPSGGPKDVRPPKLLSVTPVDSQRNARISKIVLRFDEFISLSEASREIQISPLLPVPVTSVAALRKLTVSWPDSLLEDNTTYRISFGTAVRDLNENNVLPRYNFYFSTGPYFDSLQIRGSVVRAATGLPDTGVVIMLYNATESDSAVYRHKPLYVGGVDGQGRFKIDGLPGRRFRVFALRDGNNNLTYEPGGDLIAFRDSVIVPGTDSIKSLSLRTFQEAPDTARADTSASAVAKRNRLADRGEKPQVLNVPYRAQIDTGDVKRRSYDITLPIRIEMQRPVQSFNRDRIFLSAEENGVLTEQAVTVYTDSSRGNLYLKPVWKENTVYTLRLLKGFAKDTAGNDLLPSRYTFRTKQEDDYGRLDLHLPKRFAGGKYVLQLSTATDTVYQQPVTDTVVRLRFQRPEAHFIRVIRDDNGNGRWDTGDFGAHRQPEMVYPYREPLTLKPGWENIVDFESPVREEGAALLRK